MRSLMIVSLIILLGASACGPQFTGDAHFPGGVHGCETQCAGQSLVMAAFIYVGEYSSACACKPRPPAGTAQVVGSGEEWAGADVAPVVVEIEQERAAAANSQQQLYHH